MTRSATLTMPDGSKLRTYTTRRWVIVGHNPDCIAHPKVLRRSDSLATLQRTRRSMSLVHTSIYDTITKEKVS